MDHLLKKQAIQDICPKNELDKSYFQHDMAYEDFKYLPRRTASDKVKYYVIKRIILQQIQKMMDIKEALLLWFTVFFIKKNSGAAIKKEIIQSEELAEELQKPIIIKFEKRKIHSSFKDNIWDANLADMELIRNLIK